MNIGFVWWWTGWHIFPIKNLIEYCYKHWKANNYFWFWEKWWLEEKICNSLKKNWIKVHFVPIKAWKIRRYGWIAILKNFYDLFRTFIWILQATKQIKKHQIDIIFSKWWYVSVPVAIAGKLLKKTVFLHESDTVPWLANKLIWKFATKIFLWFDKATSYFPANKTKVVWQILSDIFDPSKYNIENYKKLPTNILVIWWSQWAKFLMENILKLLEENSKLMKNFYITIIWWTLNQHYKKKFTKYKNVEFVSFADQKQMADMLAKTDISITRWWATSLAEQDIFGVKKIIVPLPFTWWNHQYRNAVDYKNDILLEQKDSNFSEKLAQILQNHIGYKKKSFKSYQQWQKIICEKLQLKY